MVYVSAIQQACCWRVSRLVSSTMGGVCAARVQGGKEECQAVTGAVGVEVGRELWEHLW